MQVDALHINLQTGRFRRALRAQVYLRGRLNQLANMNRQNTTYMMMRM